jgi:hypothetical protein
MVKMDSPKSLLITLTDPVRALLSDQGLLDAGLRIENFLTSRPSTPFWPSCGDLLLDQESRLFVGLAYRVADEDRELVYHVASALSTGVVRYDNQSSAESRRLYEELDPESHWLTITWSKIPATKVELAQLDSAYWYYASQGDFDVPVVWGLEDIEVLLQDYHLVFPTLEFPKLDLEVCHVR